MKQIFSVKKFNRSVRQVLILALCLACIVGSTPVFAAENDGASNTASQGGYKWTRIKTREDLQKYTHSESGTGTSDKKVETDTDWYRVLVLWSGGDYFLSGNTFSGGDYVARQVLSTYGMKTGCKAAGYELADTFVTRSGLNTPYIKAAGSDGDNGCDTYYFALSQNDAMSSNCLCGVVSWYGVKNAASYGFKYISAPRNNCDGAAKSAKSGGAANYSAKPSASVKFNSEGKANIFYNLSGVKDTHWEWHGSDLSNDTSTGDRFMIYIGEPVSVTTIQYGSQIVNPDGTITYTNRHVLEPSDTATIWRDALIEQGIVVVVGKGCTLVIEGECYNNGVIYVNGGTLIIDDILDTSTEGINSTMNFPEMADFDYNSSGITEAAPGTIYADNGGQILIEKDGCLLTRYNYQKVSGQRIMMGGSCVALTGNSSMFIEGGAVISAGLYMNDNSSCRVAPGAALILGAQPNKDAGHSCFKPSSLYSGRSNLLNCLIQKPNANLSKSSTDKDSQQSYIKDVTPWGYNLYMTGGSSFVNLGLNYMDVRTDYPFTIEFDYYGYLFTEICYNIDQSIASGMYRW